MHVWALGLLCETLAASGRSGLRTTTRELQMHIRGSRRFKHHQNSTRRHPKRDKKRAKMWAPHPSGAPQFGAHASVLLLQIGFGQSGRAKTKMAKNGLAKIGLAKIGQIRMAQTGLAKVALLPRGPRHEHLEHGTERLSRLKRSGDHVILGGDANSHLGPGERLSGFVGRFTTKTPSSKLSWQFVEWCVQEGLFHVDSRLSCKRRRTWYHNYVGKWYEQDVIVSTLGGNGNRGDTARARLLELITTGTGYPFLPLGRRKHPKYSDEASEKPKHSLRWDYHQRTGETRRRD